MMPDIGSVGNAYLNVVPRVEGNPEALGQSVGNKFAGGWKGAAAAGAVAVGNILADAGEKAASVLGEQMSKAFWNYADFEQLQGGVEKIFDQADQSKIFADAQAAFKDLNMSANEYLSSINQTGAAFAQTMGDQKGYDAARTGMLAIADYASGTGRDLDELNQKFSLITRATSSYQSIADQFSGILPATSADFLEQAQAAGFLSDEYTKLTDVPVAEYQEAVTKMLEKGVEDMGLAGNTAAESSETLSGSIAMMQSAWDNFLTALGEGGDKLDLTQITQNLVDSIGAVAMNVGPALMRIGEAIVFELPGIIGQSFMNAQPAIIAAIGDTFGPSGQTAAILFFDQLNAGFAQIGELLGAIFGDVSSIITQAVEALLPVVQPVVDTLGAIIGNAAIVILQAISQVTGFLAQNVMPTVTDVIGAITPVITDLLAFISEFAVGVEDFIGEAFELVIGLTEDVWPDVSETITTALDDAIAVVSPVLDGIKAAFTTAFGAVKSITSAAFPVVANVIKTAVSTAKSVVETATGGIKRAFDGIRGVASTVKGIFDKIQKAMTDPINTARETIKGALDKIKGFFPLNIGNVFSGLKLPHFSVSGGSFPWGVGGQGSMPSWSVSWYARGGFADSATLAGYGEKGTEFFWPGYEPYFDKYAQGIAKHLDGVNGGVTVNATINGVENAEDAVEQLTVEIKRLKAAGVF